VQDGPLCFVVAESRQHSYNGGTPSPTGNGVYVCAAHGDGLARAQPRALAVAVLDLLQRHRQQRVAAESQWPRPPTPAVRHERERAVACRAQPPAQPLQLQRLVVDAEAVCEWERQREVKGTASWGVGPGTVATAKECGGCKVRLLARVAHRGDAALGGIIVVVVGSPSVMREDMTNILQIVAGAARSPHRVPHTAPLSLRIARIPSRGTNTTHHALRGRRRERGHRDTKCHEPLPAPARARAFLRHTDTRRCLRKGQLQFTAAGQAESRKVARHV